MTGDSLFCGFQGEIRSTFFSLYFSICSFFLAVLNTQLGPGQTCKGRVGEGKTVMEIEMNKYYITKTEGFFKALQKKKSQTLPTKSLKFTVNTSNVSFENQFVII